MIQLRNIRKSPGINSVQQKNWYARWLVTGLIIGSFIALMLQPPSETADLPHEAHTPLEYSDSNTDSQTTDKPKQAVIDFHDKLVRNHVN